ncbi:MAG: DUF362 domain-containing protein [Syntrophobacterales bacterium]|nr:MAG: DUF362 domain-containing protein [Syntrophobacterales bacterium]
MKKSPVFFSDLRSDTKRTMLDKVGELLQGGEIGNKIKDNDLVAIKLHFGERGNTAFVRPIFIRRIVDTVRACGGKPFLTDTNTLYRGSREESISHIATAIQNGFDYSVVDAPIIIAGGIRGNTSVKVRIDKPIYREVSIAHDIFTADAIIGVAHFTGHELSGFGGALKNLAMGCSSREGKLKQHSSVAPRVKASLCTGCKTCTDWCPQGAISINNEKASIDPQQCVGCGECLSVCPEGAIQVQWNNDAALFQKKMAEYAYGTLMGKEEKSLFLNFLTQVSPACDCNGHSDAPIVGDIGILSSCDLVAIDQASIDLVNEQSGNKSSRLKAHLGPGEDKFRGIYPQIDWEVQLEYAEEIGLGSRKYHLLPI